MGPGSAVLVLVAMVPLIQGACPPCINGVSTCSCNPGPGDGDTSFYCHRSAMADLDDIFRCMGTRANQLSLFQVLFPAGYLSRNYTSGLKITNLRISSCGISNIEDGALASSYDSLESLYMYMNEILEIPREVQKCRKIKTLQLERNRIMFLKREELTNFPELNQLVLSENAIVNIAKGTFNDVRQLKSLAIAKNEIRELLTGTFNGSSELEYLNLAENMIRTIHVGAFVGLDKLKTLELHGNVLDWLPDGVFDGLHSLTLLRLDGNYLRLVTANMLQGLSSLERVWLDKNEIVNMAANSFIHSTNITNIILKRNKLTQIRRHMFAHLTNLKILDLADNEIDELEPEGFYNISGLESLSLSMTKISKIPSLAFSDMEDLRTLKLNDGRIEMVDKQAFHNLPALETLDLDMNKIRIIQPGFLSGSTANATPSINLMVNQLPGVGKTFVNQRNIRSLDLSKNPIRSVSKDSFVNLTGIEEIRLDNCHITTLETYSFVNLPRVRQISVTGGLLTHVQPKAFWKVSADTVSLINNGLKQLLDEPFSSSDIRRLLLTNNRVGNLSLLNFSSESTPHQIYLDRNEIPGINAHSMKGLLHVKELYLNHQRTNSFAVALNFSSNSAVKLQKLDLSGNNNVSKLATFAFRNMPYLQSLNLNNSNVSVIETEAFSQLPNLQLVNLQNNNIRIIEDSAFVHLPELETLHLQDNELQILGLVFNNTPRVEYLYFDNNQISKVRKRTLQGMLELKYVSLKHNKLQYLREGTFSSSLFPGLQSFYLAGNPWRCECSIAWLVDLYIKAYIEGTFLDRPKCSTPFSLRGRSFEALARASTLEKLCYWTTAAPTTEVTTQQFTRGRPDANVTLVPPDQSSGDSHDALTEEPVAFTEPPQAEQTTQAVDYGAGVGSPGNGGKKPPVDLIIPVREQPRGGAAAVVSHSVTLTLTFFLIVTINTFR